MVGSFSFLKAAAAAAAVCSYPASVGRNMDEIVRVVDALLLSAEKSVATPANWPNNHADQVQRSVRVKEITPAWHAS
jgi:alkyl hydroperoxide reductase subunit AhpC